MASQELPGRARDGRDSFRANFEARRDVRRLLWTLLGCDSSYYRQSEARSAAERLAEHFVYVIIAEAVANGKDQSGFERVPSELVSVKQAGVAGIELERAAIVLSFQTDVLLDEPLGEYFRRTSRTVVRRGLGRVTTTRSSF